MTKCSIVRSQLLPARVASHNPNHERIAARSMRRALRNQPKIEPNVEACAIAEPGNQPKIKPNVEASAIAEPDAADASNDPS